jgi:large subunit ribosomal protein L10
VRREQKVKEVESLAERLENAKAMIFTEYRGLKVSEINELRSKLKVESSTYKVVQNRLMKRVLKDKGLDTLMEQFIGPTAVASSDIDPVGPAKVLVAFAKGHDKLVLKGGYVDGNIIDTNDIERLSKMPSREELLARALASMNAPATNMAGVLAAVPRKLVYALNAIKDTKQE